MLLQGGCGIPGRSRKLSHLLRQMHKSASCSYRHVTEAEVNLEPLIFLGKTGDHGVEGSTSSCTSVALGVGLVMWHPWLCPGLACQGHQAASDPVMCPVSASQFKKKVNIYIHSGATYIILHYLKSAVFNIGYPSVSPVELNRQRLRKTGKISFP